MRLFMPFSDLIKTNLQSFLTELDDVCRRCGRKREDVQVVYATKYLNPIQFVSFLHITKEFEIGPIMIGENRVQETEEKIEFVKNKYPGLLKSLKMIMIGTLQKNKINKAIQLFDEIHSVDSLELANALNTRLACRRGRSTQSKLRFGGQACPFSSLRLSVTKIKELPVFLEVNVAGEESKHGIKPTMIDETIKSLKELKSLKLKGLMTMAPHFEHPENARPIFRSLRKLADAYHVLTSMGMSNDWKVAVEEGADMIRIGSRIFQ